MVEVVLNILGRDDYPGWGFILRVSSGFNVDRLNSHPQLGKV